MRSSNIPMQLQMTILIALLIVLTVLSSGCIHIDFGDPFKTHEPRPKEFQIVTKEGFPLNHTFDTISDQAFEITKTKPFYVKEYTEWVNISIEVVINKIENINTSIINLSTLLDRSVKVKLTGPNDIVYYQQEFTESDSRLLPVVPPSVGVWKVEVIAKGFGYGDIHDSFEIIVIAYEPT